MQPLRDLLGLVLVPAALLAALLAPDYPQELPVERYEDGVTPLYLDRPYVNTEPSAALEGLRVVRLPRHLRSEVLLEVRAPARVMRLLCDRNDDAILSGGDPVAGLPLRVDGRSCVFTGAVVERLAAGEYKLPPGGPVAASPILVESGGTVRAQTTASWNKLVPGSGPVDFVRGNKRKLAALGLVYAGFGWAYWRFRERGRTG